MVFEQFARIKPQKLEKMPIFREILRFGSKILYTVYRAALDSAFGKSWAHMTSGDEVSNICWAICEGEIGPSRPRPARHYFGIFTTLLRNYEFPHKILDTVYNRENRPVRPAAGGSKKLPDPTMSDLVTLTFSVGDVR
jgi:hypothetical protein